MTKFERLACAVRELDIFNQSTLNYHMRKPKDLTMSELNEATKLLGKAEAYLEVLKLIIKIEEEHE